MRGGMWWRCVGLASAMACATAEYPEEGGEPDAHASTGGGVGPSAMPPDAGTSGGGTGGGGSTPSCLGQSTITTLPLQRAFSQAQADAPAGFKFLFLNSKLDDDARFDVLDVELWDGYGAFTGGLAHPGTFPISGPETRPETCGVCVYLFADVDPSSNEETQLYVAQSGTVTITSVTDDLVGSLSDVMLERVDPTTTNPIGDCQSAAPGSSFDAPIQPQ